MGSDYIFVQPSFLRGVARVLDVGSTMSSVSYNGSTGPTEADRIAAQIDLSSLSSDMDSALETVLTEHGETKEG